MNIDWSKAPEDASHAGNSPYEKGVVTWFKGISDQSSRNYFMNEGSMNAWAISSENLSAWDLIVRPKKQEAWNGYGLPPVNCFCETLDEDVDCWVKVEIYAHTEFMGEAHACAKNGTDMFYGLAHEFRQIKTAEQLAEEEKVTAIAEMQSVVMAASGCMVSTISECLAIVALYEAGYRKQ